MSDQNTLPSAPETNPWDSPEQPLAPEITSAEPVFEVENEAERPPAAEASAEQTANRTTGARHTSVSVKTTVPPVHAADQMTSQIETIMEYGLGDVYKELTPVQQQEFKIKGEQTAHKIRQLLTHTKIKIKEIYILVLNWLKFLPGINRFYLEQEAKIKADKILALSKHHTE